MTAHWLSIRFFLPRMAKKLVVPAAPRTNLTSGQAMC
jgi:hypothetical protein